MAARKIDSGGQSFWIEGVYVGKGRWEARYWRCQFDDPNVDMVRARFNFGEEHVPDSDQLLCLGVTRFSREEAEELAEYYIEAMLLGRHQSKVWSG